MHGNGTDHRDLLRIMQLSDAMNHSGKTNDDLVLAIKKELRVFVRRCLEQLPQYIDKSDPRNSNFHGTYVYIDKKQRLTKFFDYNAFVLHTSNHLHAWLTNGINELPHPHHNDISFSVLSSLGMHGYKFNGCSITNNSTLCLFKWCLPWSVGYTIRNEGTI